MKWMIASDLHGSAEFCERMLARYAAEGADRLLFLGDLLYHGPRNDLPAGYAPKRVAELLRPMAPVLLYVRGNCDAEVDQMVVNFPIMAEYTVLPLGGRILFATHGHHYSEDSPPPLQKGDLLLCGHTHIPAFADHGDFLYANPGSVSSPKNGSPHSYMTMEDGRLIWKDLDGQVFMERTL